MSFSSSFVLGLGFLCFSLFAYGQQETETPRIVISIVVDQMRYDYLEKFEGEFGDNGFKRLLHSGTSFTSVDYNYKPTYTGPGHASLFTGVSPSVHGIVGNDWFSLDSNSVVYCVSETGSKGAVYYSPNRMLCETIADQIKKEHGGKTFGISLKDRSAILPAGKHADGAFWFSSKSGDWVSSSYYPVNKPNWLSAFNERSIELDYLAEPWLYEASQQAVLESLPDSNHYEMSLSPGSGNAFPYDLIAAYKELSYSLIKRIPQGNQLTADFAMHLIDSESLGMDEQLDFLSIGFSSTDYIGHRFGIESLELRDTYKKLDETIAGLLAFLDQKIGKGQYLLSLTSDHGASPNPQSLIDKGEKGGYLHSEKMAREIDSVLSSEFGSGNYLRELLNLNLYFNQSLLKRKQLATGQLQEALIPWLKKQAGIERIINPLMVDEENKYDSMVALGSMPSRSGSLVLLEKPFWIEYPKTGTTHGSSYAYDTHVPMIFYGTQVSAKRINKSYNTEIMVHVLCDLLDIPMPACSNKGLMEEFVK